MTDDLDAIAASLPARRSHRRFWTDEREALLRELWAQSLHTIDIANRIGHGCTRSAVTGAAKRFGLPEHPDSPRRAGKTTHLTRSRKEQRLRPNLTINRSHGRERAPDAVMPTLISDDAISLNQRKTLLELKYNQCRWPCGDPRDSTFFFCGGGAVEGKPYCLGHMRRARVGT